MFSQLHCGSGPWAEASFPCILLCWETLGNPVLQPLFKIKKGEEANLASVGLVQTCVLQGTCWRCSRNIVLEFYGPWRFLAVGRSELCRRRHSPPALQADAGWRQRGALGGWVGRRRPARQRTGLAPAGVPTSRNQQQKISFLFSRTGTPSSPGK